jgi:hypothetical protein
MLDPKQDYFPDPAAHPSFAVEVAAVENCLQDAVELCDQRNHLAHGIWWRFDPKIEVITVAAVVERPDEPKHVGFSLQDIEKLADRFDYLEFMLRVVQRGLEPDDALECS